MHFAVKPFSRVLLASNRELLFCNRGHVSAGAIQIWKYRLDVSTGNSVANEKKKYLEADYQVICHTYYMNVKTFASCPLILQRVASCFILFQDRLGQEAQSKQ
jgi:hypothetical protein